MFGFALTLAASLLLAYVVWRLTSIPAFNRVTKRAWLCGGGLAWIILAAGRSLGHGASSPWLAAGELVSITFSGVLFLVFLCLFPVDLATGFGRFLPRLAPRLRAWAVLAGCGLAAFATIQGLRPPVVTDYEVRLKDLPPDLDGRTLVTLSDLHLGAALGSRWMEARAGQVQALKPDLIVLLGDVFEGHGENFDAFAPAFRRLSAPLGVWAVDGNHENFGNAAQARPALEGIGIPALRDDFVQLAPGLVLAGRSGLRSHDGVAPSWNPPALRPSGSLILLSHAPSDPQGAAQAGTGLMLSGHTHGGQLWPLGYLVALQQPWVEGRYEVSGMTLLVCRGTGTWGPRMRLWRRSELLRITLRSL
jgi:predicted MPP superfamily phosphohydrolase